MASLALVPHPQERTQLPCRGTQSCSYEILTLRCGFALLSIHIAVLCGKRPPEAAISSLIATGRPLDVAEFDPGAALMHATS
eukprot:2004284-Amphidinium_carterae.1